MLTSCIKWLIEERSHQVLLVWKMATSTTTVPISNVFESRVIVWGLAFGNLQLDRVKRLRNKAAILLGLLLVGITYLWTSASSLSSQVTRLAVLLIGVFEIDSARLQRFLRRSTHVELIRATSAMWVADYVASHIVWVIVIYSGLLRVVTLKIRLGRVGWNKVLSMLLSRHLVRMHACLWVILLP